MGAAGLHVAQRGCLACIICIDVCFSVALRFLGPILVVVANGRPYRAHPFVHCITQHAFDSPSMAAGLIGLVVYVYLGILLPRFMLPLLGTLPSSLIVIFGLFILFNVRSSTAPSPHAATTVGTGWLTAVLLSPRADSLQLLVVRAHTSRLPGRLSARSGRPGGRPGFCRLRRGLAHLQEVQDW